MTQYIDKAALVVEIDNILNYAEEHWDTDYVKGAWWFVDKLQNAIDTPEVKEVDLDAAARHYLLYEHLSPLNNLLHKADLKTELQYHTDIENAFKAGFELGLKAQKGK